MCRKASFQQEQDLVPTLPLLLYLVEVFSDTSPSRGPPVILSRKDNKQRNTVSFFFEIFYAPITQIPRPSNSMLGCMC